MLELLVVRPYRYKDERHVIIQEIEHLWGYLSIPPSVKVVSPEYPPKVIPYESSERIYPFVYRCWIAYEEFVRAPAKWIAIFDADVTPLTRHALHLLLNELRAVPPQTHIVAPTYMDWLHTADDLFRTGYTANGLTMGASDGIHTIRYDALLRIVKLYNHYSPFIRNKFFPPEPAYSTILPPTIKVKTYPPHIIRVIATWTYEVEFAKTPYPPAFIHFVGDIRQAMHKILCARQLLLKEG